ncbi:MAG: hypothetical protein QOK28_591 [Actinomycetota bacterium]|jgi:hypothetical protein
MKRIFRANGLSLVVFGFFFLTFWAGQTLTGLHSYNSEQKQHHESTATLGQYLSTAHFGEATFENWESEFLQMGAFVLLTIGLRQKGSSESKPVDRADDVDEDPRDHQDDPDAPWPVRQGGLILAVYENSLSIAFIFLFLGSFLGHLLTGTRNFNNEELAHGGHAISTLQYLHSSQLWFESFQNWQSEFLAVASIVVFTIFLRQRGSSESKPVHAPHVETTG